MAGRGDSRVGGGGQRVIAGRLSGRERAMKVERVGAVARQG